MRIGVRTRTASQSIKNPVVALILVIILSLAFFIGGIILMNITLKLTQNGIKTEAVIVDYKRHTSGKSVTYNAIVEFALENGETHQAVSSMSSSNKGRPGKIVSILYMAADPDNFRFNNIFELYAFPAIFILAGITVPALFISSKIKEKRKASEQEPTC